MAKHLRHNAFANSAANISGLEWQVYSTTLAETESFEDLFAPSFWRHHAVGRLQEKDKLRVFAHDGSWDVELTVDKIIAGGALIRLYGGIVPAKFHGLHSDEIREMLTKDEASFDVCKLDHNGRPLPRVEQLEATGWRVVGNDNEVVEQGLRSKTLADNRLDKYLRDLGLRFPTPAESSEHVSHLRAREAEQLAATARKSPDIGRRPKQAAA